MALVVVNKYGEKRVRITKEEKQKTKDDDFYGFEFVGLGSAIVNPAYIIKANEVLDKNGLAFYEIVLTDKTSFFTNLEGRKLLGA
jgi:hypothetical protein